MVNGYRMAVALCVAILVLVQAGALDAMAESAVQLRDMIVVAQADTTMQGDVAAEMGMGQGREGTPSLLPEDDVRSSTALFGADGGYIHPYITLSEEYSDNLFNVDSDTVDNWETVISPGLWLSLPRTKIVPITITPHNTAPGGLQLSLKDAAGDFKRYQLYLLGGLDYRMYSEDSDLNGTNARVEGLFRYNLPSGLSLEVVDRYTYGQDRFDAGNSTVYGVRRYNSNLAQGMVDWRFTEKFGAKIDYRNFLLDYTDSLYDFLDRTDNSISAYAIFQYSPKTNFFLQYRFIDVSYAHSEGEYKDNTNNFIYAGVKWQSTAKTALRFRAGYQNKQYDKDPVDDFNSNPDGFAFEGELQYKFTVKTDISLKLSHMIEESDSSVALNKQVFAASLLYTQRFAERWKGTCHLAYEDADYDQLFPPDRHDKGFLISPAVEYLFRDWLMARIAYTYDTRNSTDDYFDYNTNRIMLSLNFAL